MKRFAWLTDIHLNFLQLALCVEFLDYVNRQEIDGVVISGDIAEGRTLDTYLTLMDRRLSCPVYFVLGNHDFYYSSVAATRRQVESFCRSSNRLYWLSEGLTIPLSDTTALLGHEGWADGRAGGYFNSTVLMTDYLIIDELAQCDSLSRYRKLNELGDECAMYLREHLPPALERFEHIILLLHVPPFREACWHEGRISDAEFLPHFTCQAAGDALTEIMGMYPSCRLTVLCGHSHGAGTVQIRDNLLVKTGGAVYGAPTIQEIIAV